MKPIKVMKSEWNNYSLYVVHDFLSLKDRNILIKDIDNEIKNNSHKDKLSGTQTKPYLYKKYRTKPWNNYYTKLNKIIGALGKLKLKNSWALKINKHSKSFLHKHNSEITSVLYLQNPNKYCGTYLCDGKKDVIVPGHENSIVIFSGRILHDAVFPETSVLKNKPRYTVITDFN
jgi:hypothetical protein|tara:strand:+ start:2352 stop:2873 length:522 start_codon:yes stop_codon:yes gene_type:complete